MNEYIYSNYIYIKKSKINGYGVFASEEIYLDTVVEIPRCIFIPNFLMKYKILDLIKKLSPKYQKNYIENNNMHFFDVYIFKSSFYMENKTFKDIYFIPITKLVFCNSSDSSNIEVRYNPEYQKIYFKSIKHIKKNEELLIAY